MFCIFEFDSLKGEFKPSSFIFGDLDGDLGGKPDLFDEFEIFNTFSFFGEITYFFLFLCDVDCLEGLDWPLYLSLSPFSPSFSSFFAYFDPPRELEFLNLELASF